MRAKSLTMVYEMGSFVQKLVLLEEAIIEFDAFAQGLFVLQKILTFIKN